jgi:hypothetical protein
LNVIVYDPYGQKFVLAGEPINSRRRTRSLEAFKDDELMAIHPDRGCDKARAELVRRGEDPRTARCINCPWPDAPTCPELRHELPQLWKENAKV